VKKRESGYTLVELLVTLAITGLVFVIAGTAIYQLSRVSGYGNNRLTAVHEMQNTAHWFSRDGQEALTAGGGKSLILTLPDSRVIAYSLSGTTLQRKSGTELITLAQDISALSFTVQNRLVTMNITTAISGRLGDNVEGTYKVQLRPQP
jgi:prepilin-type N-terminal cleavage/methylation domain-containing protein